MASEKIEKLIEEVNLTALETVRIGGPEEEFG